MLRPLMVRLVGYPTGLIMLGGTSWWALKIPGFSLGGRTALILLGVLGLLICHLEARVRLVAREHTLEVRNHLSSRTLEWAEIVDVGYPMGDPWAHLDLADGTTLATMAISTADGRRAVAAAHRLRRLIRQRGEASPEDFPGSG
ncbi:PH domain-containing protein [Brachybacterium sp. DNPG3]